MAKYHISPTTGRPNKCHAKVQCPYGSAEDHYASREEAQAAYERQMSGETFASVSKKRPALAVVEGDSAPVVSLAARRAKKAEAQETELLDARATAQFDQALATFPKYKLNKAEEKLLAAVAAGKHVPDEKLDEFLEAKKAMTELDAYSTEAEVGAAKGVLSYLRAVRAQRGTPSTLATLETFDPSTQTLFSNSNARKMAGVMGKAIRREFAHAEWMRELAGEHRDSARYAEEDGDLERAARYRKSAELADADALKSEARVQAQLRELQHLFDTDEAFAKTANPDVRRMLTQGSFRGAGSTYSGIPIGTVRKVK